MKIIFQRAFKQHISLRWIATTLFSATGSISAHGWLWWVAEAFNAPPCNVLLLQNVETKNGTRWDLVAV